MPRTPAEAAERAPEHPGASTRTVALADRAAALGDLLDRPARPTPAVVLRARQAAVCLLLVVLAFLQRPGAVSGDTKLDLTQDPAGWLADGLRVWTPDALGSLQNQAYGYLFPMGPFHLVGLAAGLPPWVVQRLWWSALLVAAFLGTVRLAARLGIGGPGLRVVAGLAYALSPRVLTELGGLSSELMPLAALPWVLVPLAGPGALRLPRRAAARSGVAVLFAGAVNAAATVVVLPLAALLLAPGLRTAAGRRLAAWWVAAVALASLWWVVPLLVQGAYSPPFLDYIESAATTTSLTSPVEVLRGTSHWLAFLAVEGVPWWPSGWTLLTSPAVVLDTAVLAALGLAGLASRSMPSRGPLVLGALLGLAVMTLGHVGPVGSPLAEHVRDLLDGPLAPFRNVHKADPLVRLPLVLGLCHALAAVRAVRPRRLLVGVTAVALAGAATPALATQLVPPGAFPALPDYWVEAADWIDERAGTGTSLLVPAASDAEHLWGRPLDDPLHVLADSPVAVRDAVPLGGPEVTRLLDAVETRLGSGRGSPGLGQVLARAGVRFVVARNDLDTARAGAARPALVRQALRESGGLSLAATFGPTIGNAVGRGGLVADRGLDLRRPAVEVWEVDDWDGPVTAYPSDGAWTVAGGPDALLQLADAGLLDDAATLVGPDAEGAGGPTALTDGLRRQAVDVGRVRDNRSPTLSADAPVEVGDLLPDLDEDRLVTAELTGIGDLRASSSAADVDAVLHRSQDRGPFAALDGDRSTYWASSALTGATGEWLDVRLERPLDPTGLTIALAGPETSPLLARVEVVEVRTDAGTARTELEDVETPQSLEVPRGRTSRLRVTVTRTTPGAGSLSAVRELAVPGVEAGRTLVLPPAPPSSVGPGSAVVLDVARSGRDACVEAPGRVRCSPDLARGTEDSGGLDRTVTLPSAVEVDLTARGRPRPGRELDELLDAGAPVRVRASSRAVDDPRGRPGAVVDGDEGTGWVAAALDAEPTLRLEWDGPRWVEGVRLRAAPARVLAARAERVLITTDAGEYEEVVPAGGRIALPRGLTDEVTIRVLAVERLVDIAPGGRLSAVPVGFVEVEVLGPSDLAAEERDPDDRLTVPCADGPVVAVGGRQVRFAASATREDLQALRPLDLRPCGGTGLRLGPGEQRVRALPAEVAEVTGVTLQVPPAAGRGGPRAVEAVAWGTEDRTVRVGAGQAQLLAVGEAFNRGWRATLDGERLEPVRVDGWRQGWRLPAGDGGDVRLVFAPGRVQSAGLAAGAVAVLVLLGLALLPGRGRPSAAPPAPLPVVLRRAAVLTGTALLLGALAGVVGLLLWASAAAVARVLPRALPLLAGAAMTAAGALVALAPWGRFAPAAGQEAPAQVLALAAVAVVALSLLVSRPAATAPSAAAPAPRPRAG